MISTIFVTLLLVCGIQSEKCDNLENTETGDYTYHICRGISIRDFDRAREFCSERLDTQRDDKAKAHLVTFPNEKEFTFLISHLNATLDQDTLFYPGIYQKRDPTNRYNPETGEFYWITDNSSRIYPNSNSFWQPFADWIETFDSLTSLKRQQTENFLMDKDGNIYPYVSFGASLGSDIDDPIIICMSKGVQQRQPRLAGSTQNTVKSDSAVLDTWVIIVIVAGGIFVLILAGVLIGCCISKKRGNFHKVPTDEKKAQQQTLQSPHEYQA